MTVNIKVKFFELPNGWWFVFYEMKDDIDNVVRQISEGKNPSETCIAKGPFPSEAHARLASVPIVKRMLPHIKGDPQ